MQTTVAVKCSKRSAETIRGHSGHTKEGVEYSLGESGNLPEGINV